MDLNWIILREEANVVLGELSRKSLHMYVWIVREFEWIEQFRDLCLVCELI